MKVVDIVNTQKGIKIVWYVDPRLLTDPELEQILQQVMKIIE